MPATSKKKPSIIPSDPSLGSISDRDTQIFNLRRAGVPLTAIGDQFGISKERVWKIIDEYNRSVPFSERVIPAKQAVIDRRRIRIESLLAAGKNREEIASALSISVSKLCRVCSQLRKEGVEIPDFRKCGRLNVHKARELRAVGATLKTIANRFGVAIPSVYTALCKK